MVPCPVKVVFFPPRRCKVSIFSFISLNIVLGSRGGGSRRDRASPYPIQHHDRTDGSREVGMNFLKGLLSRSGGPYYFFLIECAHMGSSSSSSGGGDDDIIIMTTAAFLRAGDFFYCCGGTALSPFQQP